MSSTSITRIIRITNVPTDLKSQRYGFHTCSSRQCDQAPTTLLLQWRQFWGRPRLTRLHLCEAHAARWCRLREVTLRDVPTIDFWDERRPSQPTPDWPEELLPAYPVEDRRAQASAM
jgi:hypothetical protein